MVFQFMEEEGDGILGEITFVSMDFFAQLGISVCNESDTLLE